MDAAACRAAVDKGGQNEGRAALLAGGCQSATREGLISQATAVGPADEIHQFPAFSKRSRSGVMAATPANFHSSNPLFTVHITRSSRR
jgi:hypothetical protein